MNLFLKFNKIKFLLFFVILLGAFFRFYGLDWDQQQHLHPDERFLTMVAADIKIPNRLSEYFDPNQSPMNPYNAGYSFFVYGTFPLFLTKLVGELTNHSHYWSIHFVGRILSAVFDLGVILLLFKIGKKIFNEKVGLLSAFLYSIMVLPIQLSHFFAVDTFLNFFIVLSFYFLIQLITNHQPLILGSVLGATFGLALACKISALLFLPIIGLGFLVSLFKNKNLNSFISCLPFFVFCAYSLFRFSQPQAFASGSFFDLRPNPQFISNLKELKSFENPQTTFPPAIQWFSAKPIIFPLRNLIYWGMGLPLGAIAVTSVFYTLGFLKPRSLNWKKLQNYLVCQYPNLLIVFWVFSLFLYQGLQLAKPMRYFHPIYPFLALLSAQFLNQFSSRLKEKVSRKIFFIFQVLGILLFFIYPLSFTNIYTKPITRVSASEWIYQNIPAGSTLLNEEWDDSLPLLLPKQPTNLYKGETVFMYGPDLPEKWQTIEKKLNIIDYLILTSNRAYGSTMRLPERYPQTIKHYQSLFSGTGNFKKVAEFTSYPCFPPGKLNFFCFNDDSADESFTVYDHPKVMIFKKNNP